MDVDLERFRRAQAATYEAALGELGRGRKEGHWIWWVLPQLRGLGHSPNSEYYGISGLAEARAYAADAVLGARLRETLRALLAHRDRGARAVLGADEVKLRSCATLFRLAVPSETLFGEVLDALCDGQDDPLTLRLLGDDEG